jgi:hypothetical protein
MASYKYLDYDGLLYLWQKINARYATVESVPTSTSQLTNNSDFQTGTQVASAISAAVPTKVSQLTNDSNYQTGSQVSAAIAAAVSGIETIKFEIVQSLPASGASNVIYLVPVSGQQDVYDEYIYISNSWEKIGNTDVDLSGYVQAADLVAVTNAEIDTIVAS